MMLDGLKVIELASYIAAPSSAGILADWGADVVKVEAIGGDAMRKSFVGISRKKLEGNPVFAVDNRNKRGICVNIRSEEGAAIIRRLVKDADVFITNIRPGALRRAGVDYDQIRKENPRLIYASVTGYGLQGDEQDRPGFDMAAFWARSGMARLMAPKGQEPVPLRTAIGDHVTGVTTVAGILAALHNRDRTGEGSLVEASLLRSGIYAMSSDMATTLHFGRIASTQPRETTMEPLRNFYRTADDKWVMLLPRANKDDFTAICKAVGRPDIRTDERFQTPLGRRENAPELVGLLDEAFEARTLDEWKVRLDEADLVWAPVQHPTDVADDPQAAATGAFVDIPEPDGSTMRNVASPVRFNGENERPRRPVPEAGEHTAEVLKEHGFSDADVEHFRKSGAIN